MKGEWRPARLNRTLEWPGSNPLQDAHASLDFAVRTAHGCSVKKDLPAQFPALNQDVTVD